MEDLGFGFALLLIAGAVCWWFHWIFVEEPHRERWQRYENDMDEFYKLWDIAKHRYAAEMHRLGWPPHQIHIPRSLCDFQINSRIMFHGAGMHFDYDFWRKMIPVLDAAYVASPPKYRYDEPQDDLDIERWIAENAQNPEQAAAFREKLKKRRNNGI